MTFPSSPTFPVRFKRPVSSTFPAAPTFLPVFDPTAAAFFAAQTAAGQTLTSTQKDAINTLCLSGKANGWFSAMVALYPFLGNSATCDSFNLINPATFQITWNGTVTHNANGITGDGVTGYGDTGLVAATSLNPTSNHQAIYASTSSSNSGIDTGAFGSSSSYLFLAIILGFATDTASRDLSSRLQVSAAIGMAVSTRDAISNFSLYQNGVMTGSSAVAPTAPLTDFSNYVCGVNSSGTLAVPQSNTLSFYSLGADVGAVQAAFYADVQAFQTTLGRQV